MNDVPRILILEHRPSEYELAQREIRKTLPNCSFHQAETQPEFLHALDDFQPDLILCDNAIPNLDATKVLTLTQQRSLPTPVIIWTDSLNEDLAVECIKQGAINYVSRENPQRLGRAIEQALQERTIMCEPKPAKQDYQAIFENSPVGIFQSTAQGQLISVNAAMARIYGYESPEDMIVSIHDIATDIYVDSNLREQFLRQLQEKGSVQAFETRDRRKDGSIFWTSTSARAVWGDNGQILYYEGFLQDISEKKQAEAHINDLLVFNEKVLTHSPLGILTYKLTGECVFANQNAAAIVGATIEELRAQNFHHIDTWKRSGLYALVEKAIATKTTQTGDIHHISSFGKDIWITVHCATLFSNDEEHILLSISDITERKQAENAVKESEKRLNLALAGAQMGVWEWDLHSNSVYWSPECLEMAGMQPGEFGGTLEAFAQTLHPDDVERVMQVSEAAVADHTLYTVEFRIVRKDGEIRWLSDLGQVEYDADGTPRRLIGIVQDITPRKRSELERQTLLEIMQGLARTNDLQEFLKLIHVAIAKVIPADNFFVMLHDADTGLFEEIYSVDQYDPPAPPSRLGKSITSYVFRSGEPLLLSPDLFDELVAQGEVELVGTHAASWLGVPLKTSNSSIGVLAVQDYRDPDRYSDHDKDFLASIASQVALAVERKQAERDLGNARQFLQGIQNSLSAHIAILDQQGTIVQVNRAWREFGQQNGLQATDGIGINYLEVCETATGEDADMARQVAAAIREVFGGQQKEISVEYPCHGPHEKRWFTAHITGFEEGGQKWVVLSHENITTRKLAEEALREEQEKAQEYLDIAGVMIMVLDIHGVVSMINQKGCDILGYPADEIIGKEWFSNFLPPTIREEVRQAFWKLADNHEFGEYHENTVLTRDGKERLLAWHNTTIRDREGMIIGTLSSGEDITEGRRAERALQEQQRQLMTLISNLPGASYRCHNDEDYTMEFMSDGIFQLTGWHAEAFLTQQVQYAALIHPEDRQRVWGEIQAALGESRPFELVYRILTRGGDEKYVWEKGEGVHDRDGSIEVLEGFITDITERKHAEQELRESEERFRQLAENIREVFWIIDAKTGESIYISPAAETIWGYSAEDISHNRDVYYRSILPEDQPRVWENIEKQKRGERTDIEFRLARADGSIHWIWDRAFPIFDQTGSVKTLAGIAADITERKHAEDEIRRRAQETAALLQISQALTNLDLKAILQTVGDSAQSLFDADGCRIFLMQPDGESLRCVLALQEDGAALSDLIIKLTDGVTGDVAASGRAQIVNEMQNDPRAMQVPGTVDEEEAIMFAPLKQRDQTIGVLSVRRAGAERPFQPADLALLEAFASMAASAVSNANLFEEARRRLAELEALYENGLAVGQLLESHQIGERVIETFARYLSWHHVTIRLRREDSDELEVIAFNLPGLSEEEKPDMARHFNTMIPKIGQGLSGWVVQNGLPLRTGNVNSHPQYIHTQAGIASGLYMPLKIGDRVIGVISVESETRDAFTEQDERLLATLANQAAVAFENARLYQAAQQEIVERNRAQAALWASETHYRELADSITDILFEMDHNLCYTHWNKASENLTGIPTETAIGRSMYEVFGASEEQARLKEIYQSVLRDQKARSFETEIVLKGQKRALEINAYPSARGVSVVAKDVTARKLGETLMQKRFALIEYSSHHSMGQLMQRTIDEVSALTDSHIGFLHFVEEDQQTVTWQAWSSDSAQPMTNAPEAGMHFPLDTAGVWAEAVRRRQSIIHNDYEALEGKRGLPENHMRLLREMVVPIIRNEKIVAVMGVGNKLQEYTQHDIHTAERFADYAWDVIERRRMESVLADERNQLAQRVEERTADLSRANSNLARALRVKDEFLANMSHELRTPLNAILGLSESLSEQIAGPLNEKQQKYLNTINESGHHLLSLINDILDLAKIEAGQITLDINKVDVNSVCQASLRMIKQLAQKKHQEVIFEIDPNLGWMWADERRLKQMIVNLLGNAVKFTPEGGCLGLEVDGDKAENRVIITVWDKGIGINEQDMSRLFKPFVQLDAGLAREAGGTGLGLALVAQMARLHGGSVNVESWVGQGSRFSIVLPWEPALAPDASLRLRSTGKFRAIDPNATNKPTILIIEDTREVVMMLTDYLEMNGFKIVTAQDGVEGLAQAKLSHPNLILMDIQMPRLDGFDTTQKLRLDPEFRDTPIIAMTALAMPNDRQRCLDAGMDEYISKPVNLKALTKLIRSILLEKEDGKPK